MGEQARGLSDGMRDIIWALDPQNESWQALGLRMKDHAASLLSPHGIAFHMQGSATRAPYQLSADVRRNVLLLFKEVLHNAVRHAACRQVTVRWHLTPHKLRLVISDDGRGFDLRRARGGNGLANLRRRADEIGGTVRLDAAEGRGTSVEFEVRV